MNKDMVLKNSFLLIVLTALFAGAAFAFPLKITPELSEQSAKKGNPGRHFNSHEELACTIAAETFESLKKCRIAALGKQVEVEQEHKAYLRTVRESLRSLQAHRGVLPDYGKKSNTTRTPCPCSDMEAIVLPTPKDKKPAP